jgi:hypothetical protein
MMPKKKYIEMLIYKKLTIFTTGKFSTFVIKTGFLTRGPNPFFSGKPGSGSPEP